MSLIARYVVAGSASMGVLGGIAGLIVGVFVHVATAWFAVFELGVPAAIVGGFLGLVIARVGEFVRRAKRHHPAPH